MKADREQLLNDLLNDEIRDQAVLAAGGRVLRRRRRWRTARNGFAVVMVALGVLVVWLQPRNPEPPPLQASIPNREEPAAPRVKSLTDDELLALFPDTPVGLATLPDGRKLLLFPRPEDEKKFVARF